MAALAAGLGSLVLPSLLKAVGLGQCSSHGRGRAAAAAAILGRGGLRGMRWGV